MGPKRRPHHVALSGWIAFGGLGLLAGCEAASNAAQGAGAFIDKTAQKVEQGTDDAAITLAVKGALFKADERLARAVSVGTFKGRVSLSGVVPMVADKVRAEQLARSVKDVTDVLNAIDVAGATPLPTLPPPPPPRPPPSSLDGGTDAGTDAGSRPPATSAMPTPPPAPNTRAVIARQARNAPWTAEELEACLKVLDAVAADRSSLADLDSALRRRLLEAAGRASRPERDEQRKLAKELRRRDHLEEKAAEEALLDATEIRTLRRAPVFATPDFTPPRRLLGATPDRSNPQDPSDQSEPVEFGRARKCYVCKAPYTTLHAFYDQLCVPCGDLNYAKRSQTADLSGRVALITGARVKIGYQAAILMLRAGAKVIVTTRFAHDAARRYAAEADFEVWRDRLEIHGVDLRLTPAVERLAKDLDERLPQLDFIVHNACQTVRRPPPGFYAHLLEGEMRPLAELDPAEQPLVQAHHEALAARVGASPALLSRAALTPEDMALAGKVDLSSSGNPGGGFPEPLQVFPAGALDADQQQIDLRDRNSWRLGLADVSTVELLEVQLVNAVAPFVLSSRLLPLMQRARSSSAPTRDKHIVNVSAMEGQFYKAYKTDKHPHTNMAKAALNMLTRTSAQDYVRHGIHMNSVDTGWVTDEDPAAIAARKREEHRFHPPLDIVDGAARICDPIFVGYRTGVHAWGRFFKDYAETDW